MTQRAEEWASWEVDPSTRSSVHLWTKHVPVATDALSTTMVNLLIVDRGTPAVNLVQNPSFESSDISMFEKVVTGTASQLTITQDDENDSSPAAESNGGDKLLKILRNTSGNSTQHYDGAAFKMGPVASGQSGQSATISARVSACAEDNASGNVKLKIWDASRDAGTAGSSSALPLAESTAVNLTGGDAWQELTVQYQLPLYGHLVDVRVGIVADTVWNMATYPYWIDKFMVEINTNSSQSVYVDGSLASSAGADYEWTGAEDGSISRKRVGLTRIRGFQLTNTHATNIVYIGIDEDVAVPAALSVATINQGGIAIPGATTFSTAWPIDASKKITAIASASGTGLYGVIWGVHQN